MPPAISALQARRRRILAAATELFVGAPYEAVQMDDIARSAQVAKPTVYRHFGTKEALFREVVDETLAALKAEVAGIAGGSMAPHERLRAIVVLIVQRIGRLKAMLRAVEGVALRSGRVGRRAIRRELRELVGMIAGVVGDGIAQGRFVTTDPDLAARMILGGVRMAADSDHHDPAGAMAELFLRGLQPRDADHAKLERSAA